MTFASMLCRERLEHDRLRTAATNAAASYNSSSSSLYLYSPSYVRTALWRPHLAEWYLSAIDGMEQSDGDRGNYTRSMAYAAMKIFDVVHCSGNCCAHHQQQSSQRTGARQQQQLHRMHQEEDSISSGGMEMSDRQYKMLEMGCLYVATEHAGIGSNEAGSTNKTNGMTVQAFLAMRDVAHEISCDEFAIALESVRSSLHPSSSSLSSSSSTATSSAIAHPPPPLLVSTNFFDIFERRILHKFPRPFRCDDSLFVRAEALMDRTLSDVRFAMYEPSLLALGSFVAAMRGGMMEGTAGGGGGGFGQDDGLYSSVIEDLLGYYQNGMVDSGGGNDYDHPSTITTCLREIVLRLTLLEDNQAAAESHDDSGAMQPPRYHHYQELHNPVIHVIPEYD
eukprot:CAMPEP_0181107558 /NCGR_PEP_ID=MMETSP1071-20121207/17153_1 /TAXON_ID=35127 /ORGANISM="Thalassiosira sp., Strain NH16" /LENGTH=392 /DNA_ID=CAMNT_0023191087 /DNA_START=14 /DNA_END=1192 /DNA_ORIENTATION=+